MQVKKDNAKLFPFTFLLLFSILSRKGVPKGVCSPDMSYAALLWMDAFDIDQLLFIKV